MVLLKICVLFWGALPFVTPINELPFPEDLLDCFVKHTNKSDIDMADELISTYCIDQFLWVSGRTNWEEPRDKVSFQIIQRLLTRGAEEHRRRKRSTESLLVRKEYRMLSSVERRKFHDAIKKLKERIPNTRTSVYDTLANIHRGSVVMRAAHKGANFLGWHRAYVYLFEQALRDVDERVTLPYWDWTLDQAMNDPTRSVIFSFRFAGNGYGRVYNGMAKGWGTRRNIGERGSLMSKESLNRILSRRRTQAILEPRASNQYNIELRHNSAHSWVGGDVGFMNTASRDPLFFLIHCFIDYIWWRFQQQQIKRNIDPSSDYPSNYGPYAHRPNARMEGLSGYRNLDGYSNHWTRDIYTYQMSPECPDCGGSSWLTCVRGECVSKARKRGRESQHALSSGLENQTNLFDAEHQRNSQQEGGFKNSDISTGRKHSIQNSFEINGEVSSDLWAFLPVKVTNSDTSSSSQPNFNATVYQHCKRSRNGTLNVLVRMDGLNYDGHFIEHALTDERLSLLSRYVYVAIKRPGDHHVDVMATAHDECGRMCRPMCKVKGHQEFTLCSGFMRITPNDNDMFAPTIADAMLKVWKINTDENTTPSSLDKTVYLSFVCDST